MCTLSSGGCLAWGELSSLFRETDIELKHLKIIADRTLAQDGSRPPSLNVLLNPKTVSEVHEVHIDAQRHPE